MKFSENYMNDIVKNEKPGIPQSLLRKYANDPQYLDLNEREEAKKLFGLVGCSFKKDKDGYYCYTHRARSDSYKKLSDIPESVVKFIESTG